MLRRILVGATFLVFALTASAAYKIERIPCRMEGQIGFYDTLAYKFSSPTTGTFRLSFDPRGESPRLAATVAFVDETAKTTNTFSFGLAGVPVNVESSEISIKENDGYLLSVSLVDQVPGSNDFTLAIGLPSAQVRFDPIADLGKLSDKSLYAVGYNYTDGLPYGYLPAAVPHQPDVCTFLGWAASPQAGTNGIVSVTDAASTATPMLYALWRYSYEVVLHEQEQGGKTNVLTFVSGEPSQLPRDVWTRDGYELCWTNQTSSFANGATVTNLVSRPYEVAHLYASWQDKRSWIAFDANGGAGTMEAQAYSYDGLVTLSAGKFVRVGRRFEGWAKEPDGPVAYNDGAVVSGLAAKPGCTNVLYAVWGVRQDTLRVDVAQDVPCVTNVSFHDNARILFAGVFPASHAQTIRVTNTATQAASLRVSLDPEHDGSRIDLSAVVQAQQGGVWTQIARVCALTNEATVVTFEPNGVYQFALVDGTEGQAYGLGIGLEGVQVTYDVAGGELAPSVAPLGSNFNFTVSTPYGYLPDVVRSGWHLLGWTDPVTASRCVSNDAVSAARPLLQAEWRRDPFDYLVAFSGEGGIGLMGTQALRYDTSATLKPNEYERQGYEFAGWHCPSNGLYYADCEEVLNLTDTPGVTVPLNACWSPVRYCVKYVANGGQGAEVVQTLTYGTEEHLAGNTYVRLGYDFAGWAESASGPVRWSDCAVVSNLTCFAGVTNELFAVWTQTPGRTVYENVDGRNLTGVAVSTNKSAILTGQVVGGATDTWFTVTFAVDTTCRVSLDPLDNGKRIGAGLTVAAVTNGTWVSVAYLTDRDPAETVVSFAKDTPYRFVVASGSEADYRYVVGLGTEGVTVAFDPHRTNESDQTLQLALNCSVGFAYGWYPEPVPDSTNGAFLGWFETERGSGNPLSVSDTARADRNRFIARWSNQAWTVTFDWNMASTNIVEKRYYADGVELGDLEHPDVATGTVLSWNTLQDGSGTVYSSTNAVLTNLTLYAQWYEGYVMRKQGAKGWILEKYAAAAESRHVIPSSIDGREIVAIGDGAFAGHAELTEVVIPSCVQSVGKSAFKNCTSLANVCFLVQPVEEDAETGYLEETVEVGESAFEGCSSLVTCNLPLGVQTLSGNVFKGCTAMTGFVIPFTVTEISAGAFEGCTSLTNAVVPEKVETVGSRAFGGCSGLVTVDFLGDAPEADEDIYAGAAAKLNTRYYSRTSGWPTESRVWPTGSASRKLKCLASSDYSSRTVRFYPNDTDGTTSSARYYYSGRPFAWLAPELDGDFKGWWTERVGGRQIGPYEQVEDGQSVYAHWPVSSDEGRGSNVSWGDGLTDSSGGEGAEYKHAARTFSGFVQDSDGNVRGTVRIDCKGSKVKNGLRQTESTVTANVLLLGVKGELVLKGTIDGEGCLSASKGKYQLTSDSVAAAGFVGTLTVIDGESYDVHCANSLSSGAKENRQLKRNLIVGNWTCVLKTGDVEDLGGGASAEGYSIVSLKVSADGSVKVSANMADGTVTSRKAEAIYGDGYCCIPFVLPLYTGSLGGFGGAVWMTWQDDMSLSLTDIYLCGMTEWDASTRKGGAFVAQFDEDASIAVKQGGEPYVGSLSFSVESVPEVAGVTIEDALLPNDTIVKATGKTWRVPAADKVRFIDGAWCDLSEEQANPGALKLSYASGTGLFSGSFSLRAVTDAGRSRVYTAKVRGSFVTLSNDDGTTTAVGYGTATAKGVGSMPVRIDPIEE